MARAEAHRGGGFLTFNLLILEGRKKRSKLRVFDRECVQFRVNRNHMVWTRQTHSLANASELRVAAERVLLFGSCSTAPPAIDCVNGETPGRAEARAF